jgi:hypothetical protein
LNNGGKSPLLGYLFISSRSVIPNLGYVYPQGVRPRTFRGKRKKLNNGGKSPLLGYLFTVTIHKFEITATILITDILPI